MEISRELESKTNEFSTIDEKLAFLKGAEFMVDWESANVPR